jgi:hypothetical protein
VYKPERELRIPFHLRALKGDDRVTRGDDRQQAMTPKYSEHKLLIYIIILKNFFINAPKGG